MAGNVQRPLVHVGFHKTGTTWLQQHLFTAANPVFEPLSVRPRGHATLARRFVWGPDGHLLSPFDDNRAAIDAHLAEIEQVRGDRLETHVPVMSHERLSGNPHASGFDARVVADRVAAVFPQARVLIVIREQVSALLSNYGQYLYIGGTKDLDEYLTQPYDGKQPGFSPHHFAYLGLVRHCREVFGPEAVLVLAYEQFRDHAADYFGHLSRFIGSDVTVDQAALGTVENRVPTPAVLHGLRRVNHLRRSSSVNAHSRWAAGAIPTAVDAFVARLGRLAPGGWSRRRMASLREVARDYVADRYRASNRELARITDLDLAGLGYRC